MPTRDHTVRAAVVLVAAGGPLAIAGWAAQAGLRPPDLATWLAPRRDQWYALPMVMAGFVALGAVPVVVLITATGLAFGPVLGPIYALAGCLASASAAFVVGRWLGRRRLTRWGGATERRVTRLLARNGTLAVFLIRKIPAPFTLVNLAVGASPVSYLEFLAGTTLGMGAFVVALAGFGGQLLAAWREPTPAAIGRAAAVLALGLGLALAVNHLLQRRRPHDHGGA